MPDDQRPAEQPETTGGIATCYRHPERETRLRCSRCDRPICHACAQPAAVGQLCPEDARGPRHRIRGIPGERPLVTYALLAVNTVLLIVAALLSPDPLTGLLNPSVLALCDLGGLNSAAIAENGQYWRLLTVMVLHGGLIHWALNSYALYLFGPLLERLLGPVRYLVLYLGAGFAGAAASFAIAHTDLGVGASGAIFGLLGALVAYFFRRRRSGGQVPLQNLLVILVINLFLGSTSAGIDNLAHVGGFVAGLAAMVAIEAVPMRRRQQLVWLALLIPFAVGIILTVAGIATYSPVNEPSCLA